VLGVDCWQGGPSRMLISTDAWGRIQPSFTLMSAHMAVAPERGHLLLGELRATRQQGHISTPLECVSSATSPPCSLGGYAIARPPPDGSIAWRIETVPIASSESIT
jgi:hypothetical protein